MLASCSITRKLEPGQYLVMKNKVEYQQPDSVSDSRSLRGTLLGQARPKPNDAFLGFYQLRLRAYYLSQDTSKGFNRWIHKRIAQPPALLDTVKIDESVAKMEQYMFNKGYFDATVTYEVRQRHKHVQDSARGKAWVTYIIGRSPPTRINDLFYDLKDSAIVRLVVDNPRSKPVILTDKAYDVDMILAERRRIEQILLNTGYYGFDKQYLLFRVDTLPDTNELDIYVQLHPPQRDSVHRVYTVRNVYVYPDYTERGTGARRNYDTILHEGYHFLIDGPLMYNKGVLSHAIYVTPGKKYSRNDFQLSIARLNSMRIFSFINSEIVNVSADGKYELDIHLRLLPATRREFNLSLNATTSSNYFLGSDVGISYANKNLFRNTDILTLGLNGGMEFMTDSARALYLNTLDLRASATWELPKFLVPFRVSYVPKSQNPRTIVHTQYTYFRRINFYTLNDLNFNFGYDWNERDFARHRLNPVELNFVRISDTTAAFNELIERNSALRGSFQNQLIAASSYTYSYNSTHKGRRHYFYYRLKLEVAGNLIFLGSTIFDSKNDVGSYEALGRPYSQYFRPEFDFVQNFRVRKNKTLVLRGFTGFGLTYGNSEVMPYVKQFITGGSNSLRGFRIRTIGPGGYFNPVSSGRFFDDRSGEIKLEGNAEYRFPISGMFRGAVFLDAGNIWMMREDDERLHANFAFNRFMSEIALNTGFGIRADVQFFVLRADIGLPLKEPKTINSLDPSRLVDANGWRLQNFALSNLKPWNGPWRQRNLVFNLAIGFPF